MSLRELVSAPERMLERERLLHLTAAQQLKLHAAKHGARLMMTEPEIDIEGSDFTISNEFESLYVQSKGTLKKGGRRSWEVRAALLKPSFHDRDLVPDLDGLKVGGFATGATGGVLLHVIDEAAADEGRWEVSYRYLDIFWLIGVASGAAGRSEAERARALTLLRAIRAADDQERVELKFTDFANLKSLSALAYLRLHIGGMSNWASSGPMGGDLAAPENQDLLELTWAGVREQLQLG